MYLTIKQLSAMWLVNPKTLTSWIRSGKLPAFQCGHQYRVLKADAERLEVEWKTVKEVV